MRSARSERELFYDGKTVTLYTPEQKYYSTVEFSETIGELVEGWRNDTACSFRCPDLFLWGTPPRRSTSSNRR